MMKRLFYALLLAMAANSAARAETPAEFEARLTAAVRDEGVTIVHLWATWCHNCWREHDNDGWKNFIAANPDVKVIFVSVWGSREDDHAELSRYDIVDLPNLEIWRHPNQSRRDNERMVSLLGQEVTWIPTTWVYRKGTLRYAINYGEVRFPMLQAMVDDTTASW